MKGIKRFCKEHRIFIILMAVVIVCVILIGSLLFQCFYSGGTDKYGNRLDNIENYTIESTKLDEIKAKILQDQSIKSAEIKITGKIVYSTVTFVENTDLEVAKNVAVKILEDFTEAEELYYDFNFTLKSAKTDTNDGFLISGAKNSNGNGLIWNNNRQVIESDSEE